MIVLVAGAGGFIGGHLVKRLLREGHSVRAVDVKPQGEWHQLHQMANNVVADLRDPHACQVNTTGIEWVYNLACDMGGMGFIETHRADCMVSVLINTNLLIASAANHVKRYFYASSACVYRDDLQGQYDARPLREEDAYPAMPEDGYGWEKLFSERMCRHFREDRGLETRVARFHNVYGPHGTWRGGREKAPAALCRKVIEARLSGSGEISIWGCGHQTRTFTYIDDCLRGIAAIMDGDYPGPVNLGSAELVSVDGLVDEIECVELRGRADVAKIIAPSQLVDLHEELKRPRLRRVYEPGSPTGVAGRSSDNTLFRATYGWEPLISLRQGIAVTYDWIREQMAISRGGRS